jgi:type VI secretion system protein ImpL
MKRVLIGVLVFVLWMACVLGLAFMLHFSGSRFALFCIVLGLLGAAAIAVAIWWQARGAGGLGGGADSTNPAFVNLNAILRDADSKLKASSRGARSLASSPIIYVLGDDNSAKTQTVMQSGLDAELLAGNLYRDGAIAPTDLVNIWLAGSAVIVEAGGPLLKNPPLWLRLVRATQPGRIGSVFASNPQQPTRAAVLCVSIEHLPGPKESGYNPDLIRALGQRLNERLRELSQTLGISLPIYVLFTKLDTLQHFADYATRLAGDEVKVPLGTLLAPVEAGSGLYAERAGKDISGRFDELLYTLAEFRLNVLSRGGDLSALASAYEFPRDLQKRRATLVDFLVEVARPSQLGLNPFLRGFFFSGMRAVVEDIAPAAPQPQQAPVFEAGATRVFSRGEQAQQPMQQPVRGGTRRVPQWVFLPHLFSKLLLNDESALDASRVSTNVNVLKRALLAAACCLIGLFLILATVSFFNNRALEQEVRNATSAPLSGVNSQLASVADLQTLDQLGTVLLKLDGYRKDGAPMLYRFGLYRGLALYPVACNAYSGKFRTLLLGGTQANILAQLRGLQSPPPPEADYNATYKPLKAYLITTSNPDKSTKDFLAPALLTAWQGSTPVPPDAAKLAETQFETYATLLPEPGSCMIDAGGKPDSVAVAHARDYLNKFGGFQHVYQSMLAAAAAKFPAIRYNDKFPGSVRFIVDNYEVAGAYTKGGFGFMQNAIQHPGQYFNGEEWVVPSVPGATLDASTLPAQLQKQYVADFLAAWRAYLNAAKFTGYSSLAEAATKLDTLSSNASPILELFSLISINTAVSLPEIANAFQAPQAVVPPATPENHFIAPGNQAYIQALQGLKGAIQNVTQNPLSANDPTPILGAADQAEQAAANLRNGFTPDAAGHMDVVSYQRLEDPITSVRAAARHIPGDKAGGDAKSFCGLAGPVLAKFPFNPQATAEASADEVAQLFSPGQGALAQFYTKISQLVVLQGGQYGPAPNSSLPINPGFLSFFNAMEKVSSALFPAGGNQPTLSFSLTETKVPGTPDALLNIDGQQVTAGQTTSFRWISQPSSKITLTSDQGNAPAMTGSWSVFKLGFLATHPAPNRLDYSFQFQGHTNQVVHFEADGSGAPLLDPHFMGRLHCTSAVVRQ